MSQATVTMMVRSVALRAAGVQLLVIGVFGLATGLTLPHSFFAEWGWLVGPGAWMTAAAITARVLSLPLARTLLGAILAGLPSGALAAVGLHDLGILVAIPLFGAWCGVRRTLASDAARAPA